jgi:hypothetical protein
MFLAGEILLNEIGVIKEKENLMLRNAFRIYTILLSRNRHIPYCYSVSMD